MVILDDVHERSVSYDILFSFLKRILNKRKENFKVIVTSATADTQGIADFFSVRKNYKEEGESLKVTNVNITGRLHEVFIHYLK